MWRLQVQYNLTYVCPLHKNEKEVWASSTDNTNKMADKQYLYLVNFIIFALAVLLLFKIVKPLITIFLTSVLITYITFPLYKRICKRIKYNFLAIILTIFIIVLIALLPLSYMVFKITQETLDFYVSLSGNIAQGTLLGFTCEREDSYVCQFIDSMEGFSATTLAELGFGEYLQEGVANMLRYSANYLVKIPGAVIAIALSLFISYFLFRDGESIMRRFVNWLPFNKKTVSKFIGQFQKITYIIVFAQLFVAVMQGVVGGIGFLIFGMPLPLFWGVVMAFLSLMPTFGAAMVWVPASLFLALSGYFTQEYITAAKGIGLFVYGLFVISTIDNILRVKLIHAKAEVHPIVVIAGVIGGAKLFGLLGIFLGPIIVSLLITYFESMKDGFV